MRWEVNASSEQWERLASLEDKLGEGQQERLVVSTVE